MNNDGGEFEIQVRRIAREIWPNAGGLTSEPAAGREHDAVFVTADIVHILEATIERAKKKAESDISKIQVNRQHYIAEYPNHIVKGWFVTRDEPTSEQVKVAQATKGHVTALSFRAFYAKLIDADKALSLRERYPFGSADDPRTGSKQLEQFKFIEVDLYVKADGTKLSFQTLVERLQSTSNNRFVLTGDFGIGKSIALRELFLRLANQFRGGQNYKFPVLLNLRDHQGQNSPDEALRRHAKSIGFSHDDQLVRAWRAGCVQVLLDGFDELVPSGWTQLVKSGSEARLAACSLIRNFIKESSYFTPIFIAGRDNYFDSHGELLNALHAQNFTHLNHPGFTEDQAIEFIASQLRMRKSEVFLPDWLPPKPLLLGWFATSKVLSDIQVRPTEFSDVGSGWNWLLDKIAAREVERSPGVSPEQLRRLIETMALIARRSPDPLGAISPDLMADAFKEVFGIEPDIQVRNILDRLCGLALSEVPGQRRFIDAEFYQAAQAGAIFEYVSRPQKISKHFASALEAIDETGANVVFARLGSNDISVGAVLNAFDLASREGDRSSILVGDILKTLLLFERVGAKKFQTIYVSRVIFSYLELDPANFDDLRIVFQECLIRHCVLHDFRDDYVAFSFVGSDIEVLECSNLILAHKSNAFDKDSTIRRVEVFSGTTDAIMESGLPLGLRILKTVLRKLFFQKGAGRQERSFYRGMGSVSPQLVGSMLQLVREAGFATPTKIRGRVIWHPNRAFAARAKRIVDSMRVLEDERAMGESW